VVTNNSQVILSQAPLAIMLLVRRETMWYEDKGFLDFILDIKIQK
jgi:hypothetical protein